MSLQNSKTQSSLVNQTTITAPPAKQAVGGPFGATQHYLSPASKTILLFGDQKTGKTTTIKSLPRDWKLHIIDYDGGLESIDGYNNPRYDVVGVNSFGELHAAMWNLDSGYDAYILDTYTTAMKRFKTHVKATMGNDPKAITNWQKVGGAISTMAVEYLDRWRDLVAANGAWGIIICQDKHKDIDGGVKLAPDLVGACARDAAGMVNFLLHLERKSTAVAGKMTIERVFRTADTPTVMAGDRSRCLNEFEPADLGALIEKVTRYRESKVNKAFVDMSKGEGKDK